MAPKGSMASLFHPKKPKKDAKGSAPASPSAQPPRKTPITRQHTAPPKEEDEELQLPDTPFQEFKLMSSSLNGWKYDVMKFDSRKPVELTRWQLPIKLNRKEMRSEEGTSVQVPVGPMLGLDGKPVIGVDGQIVMVDAEGKMIQPEGKDKDKDKDAPPAKKKFQKKTKQVFKVDDETRRLRREERYPWVIEDATGAETWYAQLEDTTKATTHAFFMPAANDIFKFVPAHRWYKFQKKLKHEFPTDSQGMEAAFTNRQKRDPQQWLAKRNGKGPSDETVAMFKAESEGRALAGSSTMVHSASHSLGPNGRKLKTVDSGMNGLFGDDDEDGSAKRRLEKEYGGEGDLDEMVYEEEFADDDEKIEAEAEDDEVKELEERLKREYKNANKTREGNVDESDDEEMPGMTKQAKAMQKLIRNREGNDAYDSDEEKNPYASSEEEEEEEELPTQPVIIQPPVPPGAAGQPPGAETAAGPASPTSDVRATSPLPSPGLGGHSVVAKRATSPNVGNKLKTNGSRAGSRAGSPLASRATSPLATGGSRAGSPVATANGAAIKKRKATEDAGSPSPTSPTAPNAPTKKKRRVNAGAGELEDKMVIEWLKNTPNATTRDCIQYFQPYFLAEGNKAKFTALIKEVASLKNGVLILKPEYSG
ncbi:unnamed protein product [Mycena citricolor]|uniref:Transcription initiation factor IIF subunit alpha n=1 Tax=Mycena citricolor TaxID=2018698 RepID=A0AAD2GRR2_9AGAR|nr:unnamed protein product [Mycena citricolor]CAK5275647.1 unnamed protein product [Mycena citricolor]